MELCLYLETESPKMEIYIPSYQRPDKVEKVFLTLDRIGLNPKIVCSFYDSSIEVYKNRYGKAVLEYYTTGIRQKRQAILDTAKDSKIIMVDDDVEFYHRISQDPVKLRKSADEEIKNAFNTIDSFLENYAHGGLSQRFMNNYRKPSHEINTAYFQVLCFNKNLFPIPYPKFRFEVGEELDMNLQLLRAKRANFVISDYAIGSWGFKRDGGTSLWRTDELEYNVYNSIADTWPDVVKVRKVRGNMGSKVIPTISWAKIKKNWFLDTPSFF